MSDHSKAALSGTLHMPMSFDELASLSPVVRNEVLTGELVRRLRSFPEVKEEEIDPIVQHLLAQNLDTMCSGLQNSSVLLDQIRGAKEALGFTEPSPPQKVDDPYGVAEAVASMSTSTLLDPSTLAATASAPEHPSTPVSFTPSINTPPRTASPTGSIAPGTEKERLLAAVISLDPSRYGVEPTRASEIVEMLLSLSKKERAMCLFSADYLRTKVESARNILDALAEDEEPSSSATPLTNEINKLSLNSPTTPQAQHRQAPTNNTTTATTTTYAPQTPDLSSRGNSAAASPAFPQTPASSQIPSSGTAPVHTLATLAKLPAVEIIKLASTSQLTGLPLPKADPNIVQGTDQFVDGLTEKPMAVQKQLLGEKL
jgi:polyadenylate-binding protein